MTASFSPSPKWRQTLFAALFLLSPVAAGAVEPTERLADPALEARARVLSKDFRCLVCQNQSIDDSNASLAVDLRRLVRERLAAGDSDAAVRKFLVDRYGDFVLLDPPVKTTTYLLWASPVLVLVLAGWGFASVWRRRATSRAAMPAGAAPLTPAEQARLAELLGTPSVNPPQPK